MPMCLGNGPSSSSSQTCQRHLEMPVAAPADTGDGERDAFCGSTIAGRPEPARRLQSSAPGNRATTKIWPPTSASSQDQTSPSHCSPPGTARLIASITTSRRFPFHPNFFLHLQSQPSPFHDHCAAQSCVHFHNFVTPAAPHPHRAAKSLEARPWPRISHSSIIRSRLDGP